MTLDKAIRIGELLQEQKAGLKHGEWLPWVKENLPFSERLARDYMRFYNKREELKTAKIADLDDARKYITPPIFSSGKVVSLKDRIDKIQEDGQLKVIALLKDAEKKREKIMIEFNNLPDCEEKRKERLRVTRLYNKLRGEINRLLQDVVLNGFCTWPDRRGDHGQVTEETEKFKNINRRSE